ncbi:unnamed protein product [Candida verbasci]|uniref:SGF29 C-terminal domain-containing protein n=1 Tax=Candida verbasci TaxID=1227364 RepID=A0A9W4U0E6_9ASCO|nr:unnamed protein product [Candida verbasci]
MQQSEVESHWDVVITSLQDICNSNESLSFNNLYSNVPENTDFSKLKEDINDHKLNIGTAKRLIDTSQENLLKIITHLQTEQENQKIKVHQEQQLQQQEQEQQRETEEEKQQQQDTNINEDEEDHEEIVEKKPIPTKTSSKKQHQGKTITQPKSKKNNIKKKVGKSFWQSKYTPSEPIYVGSEVAYKLKNNRFPEEWINCEVLKILGNDGSKFEIRDPEPDENNNPGRMYKATWKEILLIPPKNLWDNLINYAYGTKVLAQYPETTTFYPAIVVGNKKDGNVRLIFDGEEEDNKETEVARRLVLPYPIK